MKIHKATLYALSILPWNGSMCDASQMVTELAAEKIIAETKYRKAKMLAIGDAIKRHDYDYIKKELLAFVKKLGGVNESISALIHFLIEAIYTNDLTMVKLIVSVDSTKSTNKKIDVGSRVGPQGTFTPMWHAQLNANGGKNPAGQEIYKYLLNLNNKPL